MATARQSGNPWQKLEDLGGSPPARLEPIIGDALASQLKALEALFGKKLPGDYSDFLAWSRGRGVCFGWNTQVPAPEPYGSVGVNCLFGLNPDDSTSVQRQTRSFQQRIPQHLWIIGDDAGGNKICLRAEDNSVYFWDHEVSNDRMATMKKLTVSFKALVEAMRSDRQPGEQRTAVPAGLKVPAIKRMGSGRKKG